VDNHDSSSDDISVKLKTAEEARERAANLKGMQAKLQREMAKISAMADNEQNKYKNVVSDIAREVGQAAARNKVKQDSMQFASHYCGSRSVCVWRLHTKRACKRRNGECWGEVKHAWFECWKDASFLEHGAKSLMTTFDASQYKFAQACLFVLNHSYCSCTLTEEAQGGG
jgi:hypothetical protein